MNRNAIALVWLGGIALAALLYVTGPAHVIYAVMSAIGQADWVITGAIAYLSAQTFDLVRAAALALFVVFLVLGALASQRGTGRGSGLVGVSVLFVVLVALGGTSRASAGSRLCWLPEPGRSA